MNQVGNTCGSQRYKYGFFACLSGYLNKRYKDKVSTASSIEQFNNSITITTTMQLLKSFVLYGLLAPGVSGEPIPGCKR